MLTLGQRISVIKSINNHVKAEKIFLHSNSNNGITLNYVTVIVANHILIPVHEMVMKKYLPLEGHEGVLFVIHRNELLITEISNGNIYLLWVCTPANLIYSNPNTAVLLPLSDLKSDIITTAIVRFSSGIEKVNTFIQGALFYQQQGENGLTTFMLHQAAEITYRTIGQSLLGKEVRSHKLHVQQIWLSCAIPHLPVIFGMLTTEENELLELINGAYASARYEPEFLIQEQQILHLFDCINSLIKTSITLAEELLGISSTHTLPIMAIPMLSELSSENRYLRTRTDYFTRMNRAQALLKGGESLLEEGHYETIATLFSQSITQVCLAIIGLYTDGYQPGHILLTDLLDLCQTHWPQHKLQLHRKNPKYQKLYTLLYKSESAHRYDPRWHIKKDDLLVIRQLCSNFLQEAGLTGIKKLYDLEQFNP